VEVSGHISPAQRRFVDFYLEDDNTWILSQDEKSIKGVIMKFVAISAIVFFGSLFSNAADLKVNDPAPVFTATKQDGTTFDLNTRKGKDKWTVLYFYPKAGTPGCTKQACAFRDSLNKIKALGAEVYGISGDDKEAQAKFHKEHQLNFDLIADPDAKVIDLYGTKIPLMKVSKRWTFVLDPDLKIKDMMKDTDPMLDSERVAKVIADLQKKTK
jgi:peroxiredoxin Q/BCP